MKYFFLAIWLCCFAIADSNATDRNDDPNDIHQTILDNDYIKKGIQPTVSEILGIAMRYSPEEYVDALLKIDCFNLTKLKYKEEFKNLLNTVAKNSAGKILLFRILVELNRKNIGQEIGLGRDLNKVIEIEDGKIWSYSEWDHTLKINLSEEQSLPDYSHKKSFGKNKADDTSIYLFHELLHWLHSLQSIETYSKSVKSYKFMYSLYDYFKVNGVLGKLDEKQIKEKDGLLTDLFDKGYKNTDKIFSILEPIDKYVFRKDFKFKDVVLSLTDIDEIMYEQKFANISAAENFSYIIRALNEEFGGKLWMFKEWGGASNAMFVMEELYTVIGKTCTSNSTDGTELSENLYRYFGGYAPRLRYNLDNSIKIGTYSFTIWIDRVWVLLLENIATSLTFMGQGNTLIKLYERDKHLKRD